MKRLNVVHGILLILVFGCNLNSNVKEAKTENSQLKLGSTSEKQKYLEKIFTEDQKVRGSHGSDIMLKYGKDSKEHQKYVQTQIDQDALNLSKIEKYFELYGHPKIIEVGEIAAQTPWAVIHHANTYEDRERNFFYLYKAYLNQDIDGGAFSMYLGRMYEIKHEERFIMESPFKSEDEINHLLKELNLDKNKAMAQ